MATRLGAAALHLDHLIGTLEPGKRADLILVDVSTLHNSPRFCRDASSLYSQLVYAAKSTDVSDMMVNGRWLMRDRQFAALDETELVYQAADYARRIDAFLIEREQSVLSKLIAIGGATEGESFEVQVKVRIPDPAPVLAALERPELEVLYSRHYHEYDVYFIFADPNQGLLRYREDEYIDDKDRITNVRYRLTLIGRAREGRFESDVLLSRSRFIAPATHSLRFYREYFKPARELTVEKHRLRWRVLYHGTEFFINLDRLDQPPLGHFLEVKSRTWSRRDAEHKAEHATDLIRVLSVSPDETLTQDYAELVDSQ
jgi:5-methylthioadenosine/S-adenosylhomocysteine deaminase